MYGHDPLLIILLLVLVGLGIGWIQHRRPAIGETIDVATKVLITLIGLLIFASNGTTEQNTPTTPHRPCPRPQQTTTGPAPAQQQTDRERTTKPLHAPLSRERQSSARARRSVWGGRYLSPTACG
ncbi:hypothetical protein ACFYXM_34265 [Streptomyces sp. NPDC002476]|uniref:hypothetical protein n=1 Tax=Streptomyces sp. NPDC002476 TaxID=3364648 RepID=UPI00367A7339